MYFLIVKRSKASKGYIDSSQSKDRRENYFLIKEHLRIHSPTLHLKGSSDCHALNYTEHLHYVNRLLSSIFMRLSSVTSKNHAML
jgi:hypothetical protein